MTDRNDTTNTPRPGELYALTSPLEAASMASVNTWAESRVGCHMCGGICDLAPGRVWTCPHCRTDYSAEKTTGGKLLGVWERTDGEAHEAALEILPPALQFVNGFLLGVPMGRVEGSGETAYVVHVQRGEAYWKSLTTMSLLQRHLAGLEEVRDA